MLRGCFGFVVLLGCLVRNLGGFRYNYSLFIIVLSFLCQFAMLLLFVLFRLPSLLLGAVLFVIVISLSFFFIVFLPSVCLGGNLCSSCYCVFIYYRFYIIILLLLSLFRHSFTLTDGVLMQNYSLLFFPYSLHLISFRSFSDNY